MDNSFIFNLVLSSTIISFCTILARKEPRLAGFVISLPLSTMLVLAFSYFRDKDLEKTTLLAKSIFIGLPLSLSFFIPFFFAEKFRLGFWQTYTAGVALIAASYFIHRAVMGTLQ